MGKWLGQPNRPLRETFERFMRMTKLDKCFFLSRLGYTKRNPWKQSESEAIQRQSAFLQNILPSSAVKIEFTNEHVFRGPDPVMERLQEDTRCLLVITNVHMLAHTKEDIERFVEFCEQRQIVVVACFWEWDLIQQVARMENVVLKQSAKELLVRSTRSAAEAKSVFGLWPSVIIGRTADQAMHTTLMAKVQVVQAAIRGHSEPIYQGDPRYRPNVEDGGEWDEQAEWGLAIAIKAGLPDRWGGRVEVMTRGIPKTPDCECTAGSCESSCGCACGKCLDYYREKVHPKQSSCKSYCPCASVS
jgi:hypothetical protein